MPTIAEIRSQYPQYNDMSDADLAGALHKKFYSDMPREQFDSKIGLSAAAPAPKEQGNMLTDIGSEIYNAAGDAVSHLSGVAGRGEQGPIEGLLSTGRAALAVPELLLSPAVGAYRSLIGHPVATAETTIGGLIDPKIAKERSESGAAYEDAKRSADMAMSAARPGMPMAARGVPMAIPPRAPVIAGPGQEAAEAANRLSATGAPVQIPRAVASDSMPVQQAGAVASNIPVAGTPLVKASENAIAQLGTKADEVAAGYGGASSTAEAGDIARTGLKDWITTDSAKRAGDAYSKVDALIDPAVKAPLNNTIATIQTIEKRRTAAGLGQSKAAQDLLEGVTRPEGLTYEGLKTLRTSVGEKLDAGIIPEGMSQGELKTLYGSLSKDLAATVDAAGGPQATAAFNRANKYYELISERRKSLAKIIGADGNASAETVIGRIEAMAGSTGRADVAKLAQARKAIGADAWNEIASTVVSRLGRDAEGNFSPQRFVTAYGKMSDAGKNILFRSGGKSDLAGHLDDIAKVSSRFKELQKFANPSGTARAGLGGLIGAGLFTEPLTVISNVVGGRILSAALAKPASAASIAKWSRAKLAFAQTPNAVKLAAFNTASRNLISTMALKEVTVTDFLRALQAPSVSRADDKK